MRIVISSLQAIHFGVPVLKWTTPMETRPVVLPTIMVANSLSTTTLQIAGSEQHSDKKNLKAFIQTNDHDVLIWHFYKTTHWFPHWLFTSAFPLATNYPISCASTKHNHSETTNIANIIIIWYAESFVLVPISFICFHSPVQNQVFVCTKPPSLSVVTHWHNQSTLQWPSIFRQTPVMPTFGLQTFLNFPFPYQLNFFRIF